MYSDENYLWGAVAYGLGVALVCPAVFKVSNFVMPWRPLRAVIKVFFLTLMLTPVRAYQDTGFMAPAWMVAVFEIVRPTSPQGPATALAMLATVFAGLTVLTIAYYAARYVLRRRARPSGAVSTGWPRQAEAGHPDDQGADHSHQDQQWPAGR